MTLRGGGKGSGLSITMTVPFRFVNPDGLTSLECFMEISPINCKDFERGDILH